jgi:hypothetical protein
MTKNLSEDGVGQGPYVHTQAERDISRDAPNPSNPTQTEDWVMVPKAPTPEMIEAGGRWGNAACGGDLSPDEITAGCYRAMLSAALSSAPVSVGWQDIASAPKDGTAVLVWSNGDPSIASFDGQWTALVDGIAVTETTPNTGLRWWTVYPTHWTALPPPPANGEVGT